MSTTSEPAAPKIEAGAVQPLLGEDAQLLLQFGVLGADVLEQWRGHRLACQLEVARFLDDQATRRPRATPHPGEAAGPGSGQAGTSPPVRGAPEVGG